MASFKRNEINPSLIANKKNDIIATNVRLRIQKVLSHMEENRKISCSSSILKANNCSGNHNTDKILDIEDMVSQKQEYVDESDLMEQDKYLLDPKLYRESQKPLLEASTLPRHCYLSNRWYRHELNKAFLPSWTIIGREDEIPEPGMFLTLDLPWAGPIAVCRANDMKLYAFANSCKHRGAKVLQDKKGKASVLGLVCPYHAWTYDFDGVLKWAPGMNNAKNFNEDDIALAPIHIDTFHGFIFINALPRRKDIKLKSLKESLGDISKHLQPWFDPVHGKAKNMKCVKRRTYIIDCNWKFLMENTCETYHTSVVHKNSLGPMKAKPVDPHVGDWDAVRVPSKRSIVPLPTDFKDVANPLPPFTDQTAFVNIFPSCQINATWDCLWFMRLIPLGVNKTEIEMGFCFPNETIATQQFPSVLPEYLKRWHIAVSEDNAISLNQRIGVESIHRVPGRFSQLEFGTHNFNNWLINKVIPKEISGFEWNPGKRVFVGRKDELFSNDDEKMMELVENGL